MEAEHDKWAELESQFPEWLPKVEKLAGDLVEVMMQVHVHDNGSYAVLGVWQETMTGVSPLRW